jgi:hypothetical protein
MAVEDEVYTPLKQRPPLPSSLVGVLVSIPVGIPVGIPVVILVGILVSILVNGRCGGGGSGRSRHCELGERGY